MRKIYVIFINKKIIWNFVVVALYDEPDKEPTT